MKEQIWPDDLIIVRHGQSARNVLKEEARKSGVHSSALDGIRDMDVELTNLGVMQSRCVGSELRARYPDVSGHRSVNRVYVSPFRRAIDTYRNVCISLGYMPSTCVYDERLAEIDFGLLDGLPSGVISHKYPEETARRLRMGKYWYRPPGGENRPDVKIRLRSFLDTLVRDARGTRTLVICHSVVVLSFRSLLEHWAEDDYMQVDKEDDVKNCSLTTYRYDFFGQRKLMLKEYNHICYPEE